MSKHHQTPQLYFSLFLLSCIVCSTTYAQRSDFLPASTISAPSAASFQPQIMKYAKDQVAKMQSDNPADQRSGRDQLINVARNQNATDSFLDTLASSLNDELVASKKQGNLRCRLNIAIAVAAVAQKASARVPNTKLEPITEILLKDKSQPICLWGIKAAAAVMPSLLITGQDPKVLAQLVIDAAKEHSDCQECGAVIEEAYNALTLGGGQATTLSIPGAGIKSLLPYTMQLLAFRLSQYQASQAGNAASPSPPPPNPTADSIATNFFVRDVAWSAMDGSLRSNALKLMVDLVDQLVKQLPQGASKEEVAETIKRVGGAFEVIGQTLRSNPLEVAGKALGKIGNDPDPADLTTKLDAVKDAIKALGLPQPTINPAPAP